MRFFVGVTDYDWFRFLAPGHRRAELLATEWRRRLPGRSPGELFLFKLHSPRNFVVGGGFFAHWSALPVSLA